MTQKNWTIKFWGVLDLALILWILYKSYIEKNTNLL